MRIHRRRWFLLVGALVMVTAVVTVLLWLGWDGEYGEMKARYDRVTMQMKLEEAEAILGLHPGVPSWSRDTAPVELEEQEANGPFSSLSEKYYLGSSYLIILCYETSTGQIIRKELRKKPDLLNIGYRKYFEPNFRRLF
jgi:hypothetical protein